MSPRLLYLLGRPAGIAFGSLRAFRDWHLADWRYGARHR